MRNHGLSQKDVNDKLTRIIKKDTNFNSGKIQCLISTTVIEVGIDIEEATILIIEHAERFGLAQLHQLRGRIGRNNIESNCIACLKKLIFSVCNIVYISISIYPCTPSCQRQARAR